MKEKDKEKEQLKNEAVPNADEEAKEQKNNAAEEKKSDDSKAKEFEERESKLAEREKALEISERKMKAKELITSKDLPIELIDFIDYSNDEAMNDSINKLAEIIHKYSAKPKDMKMTVQLGTQHKSGTSGETDSFMKGFKI